MTKDHTQHIHDCCSHEEKTDSKTVHNHDHDDHDHGHGNENKSVSKQYLPASSSFVLLIVGIAFDNYFKPVFFTENVRLAWYLVVYLPVAYPVLKNALKSIRTGQFFSEFFLMSIATVGAFAIYEYPEGVAVMLFYTIGELFQEGAVNRAKRSIKALLDIRPEKVTVGSNSRLEEVVAKDVKIGEIIQVKPGEQIGLDGELISEKGSFNTAALTGESKPATKYKGETVLAGMINLTTPIEVKVTAQFKDSTLSKILAMVEQASSRKAKTQLFISKFARIYTPIVVFLAIGITFGPYLFLDAYLFKEWLYRALVFLVISCPCALVVSIPLGYFGGIGLASKNGILFKGSNYLDLMTEIDTVVMDKTGTLTKGVFKVQKVEAIGMEKEELLRSATALEIHSTHPIAKAVVEHAGKLDLPKIENVEEIAGHGLKGIIEGKEILVGNLKLLKRFNIEFDPNIEKISDTMVLTSIGGKYTGYITIADEIKEDAAATIKSMHAAGIRTVMLSGDKQAVVDSISNTLAIDYAYGDLLPDGKVEKVQELKDEGRKIAFVGDGVNDAPVIALADVGIAMGGLGSDAAIETADMVIQNDQPSKIISAIKIGKITKWIVWQNITLAFTVKAIVLILGAGGLATLWQAVFADVGVALLAILNAYRIQCKRI